MRGSLHHNLILVKIPWIWNNQCGEKQSLFLSITAACDLFALFMIFLFRTSSALRSWMCMFFFSILCGYNNANPLSTSSDSYLPPFKGFIRDDAVVPGHQRVDGLIEALSKPGVVVQLCHALLTGAQSFGEKVYVLEEIEWGVPESVTEDKCCKCNNAKQHCKSPDFPPLR